MRSVLLIPDLDRVPPGSMTDGQVSRCKEAKIDYMLSIHK